jgi:thiosulfate dehydrogenase [quinone] large subunit
MSAAPSSAPPTSTPDLAGTFAFLVLRLWLGLRSLLTGLEKYAGKVTEQQPLMDEFGDPDINGAMVSVTHKVYGFEHYHGIPLPLASKFAEEPLLPAWSLSIYGTLLGPALILFGLTLLLGIAPRVTLLVQGLIYCSLSVGLILLNESGGVAWLAIHVLLVVAALRLVAHNRFSLFPRW